MEKLLPPYMISKQTKWNSMNRQNIIIDCDPGHDDAIALLIASYSPKLNLLGVSTSSGNQTVEKTSINASNLLHFFNRTDVPIAIGSPKPIIRESRICPEIHGESGLDGFYFPKYDHQFSKLKGYEQIIKILKENDDVIVVTTGPMTNLGLAIKNEPSIVNCIKEIVLMGGSTNEGNITKAAEFNILVDPEAANICFRSGVPLRMIGLNVTRQILVKDEIVEEAEKLNTRGSDLFVKLMKVFNQNQRDFFGLEAGPLHDPATIVSLLNDKAIRFEEMNVEIDTSFTDQAGKTICQKKKPYNCLVATSVNLEEYWKEIYKHLEMCK